MIEFSTPYIGVSNYKMTTIESRIQGFNIKILSKVEVIS
jgi:hypothetical protein